VISITVSSPEKSHFEYNRMPSLTRIYHYVINLNVSLPIRRGPGVIMNISVQEHRAINNEIFWCGKVYYSNTIIITILMYTFIPNCRIENILSPQFCIKISQNFQVVLRKILWILIETVGWIISFLFTCYTHIRSNDNTPVSPQKYIWHPLTNSNLVNTNTIMATRTSKNILWFYFHNKFKKIMRLWPWRRKFDISNNTKP
jgi:hypothetical protein